MPIIDPNFPAPTSEEDVIALLAIGGVECIKPSMEWLEANHPEWAHTLKRIHRELEDAGYALQELLGQPEGKFGAGGGGKPTW